MKCDTELNLLASNHLIDSSTYKNSEMDHSLSFMPSQVLKDGNIFSEVLRENKIVQTVKKHRHAEFCKVRKNSQSPHKKREKVEDKLDEAKVVLWSPANVTLGWKSTYFRGCGMTNLGNTCYLNSSLQALFHIPSFANWLLEDMNEHSSACNKSLQFQQYCSVCAMMETLRISLEKNNSVIKPSLVHNRLKSIGKCFVNGRQEDAHEFIKMLLDHMEKSYLSSRKALKLDHRSKETTPLNQIFGGYNRQQVICPECHNISTTFSHFQDIVLDIRGCSSIEEALGLYFRKETLDEANAYKCVKCQKKVAATKRHLIERAPNVLLLQLKRFIPGGGKITKHITMPQELDISRYINGQKKNLEKGYTYRYRLVSMVIHLGSHQNVGHYTAIAQASSGTMFEFDDSSVHPIAIQRALSSNPYIVFYELIKKPDTPVTTKQFIKQKSSDYISKDTDYLSKSPHSAKKVFNGKPVSSNGTPTSNGLLEKSSLSSPFKNNRDKISIQFHLNKNRESNGFSKSSFVPPSSRDVSTVFSGVSNWNGDKCSVGRDIEKERIKCLQETESDKYNTDYDSGKYPKKKKDHFKERNSFNPFQRVSENKRPYKNDWQSNNSYRHHGFKPKYNHQKSWKDKRIHPYNQRNNYKPHHKWHDRNRDYKKNLYA